MSKNDRQQALDEFAKLFARRAVDAWIDGELFSEDEDVDEGDSEDDSAQDAE